MKTKKYLKIASLAVVAAIFIWTFVVFVPEIPAHCKGI